MSEIKRGLGPVEAKGIERGTILFPGNTFNIVEAATVGETLRVNLKPTVVLFSDIHDSPFVKPRRGNHGGHSTVEIINAVLDYQLGNQFNLWAAEYKIPLGHTNGSRSETSIQMNRDIYNFFINLQSIVDEHYPENQGIIPPIHVVGLSLGAAVLMALRESKLAVDLNNVSTLKQISYAKNNHGTVQKDPLDQIKSWHFYGLPYVPDFNLSHALPTQILVSLYPNNGVDRGFGYLTGLGISALAIAHGNRHLNDLKAISEKHMLAYWRNVLEIYVTNNFMRQDLLQISNILLLDSEAAAKVKQVTAPAYFNYQLGDKHGRYRGLLRLLEAQQTAGLIYEKEVNGSPDGHFPLLAQIGNGGSLRWEVLGY